MYGHHVAYWVVVRQDLLQLLWVDRGILYVTHEARATCALFDWYVTHTQSLTSSRGPKGCHVSRFMGWIFCSKWIFPDSPWLKNVRSRRCCWMALLHMWSVPLPESMGDFNPPLLRPKKLVELGKKFLKTITSILWGDHVWPVFRVSSQFGRCAPEENSAPGRSCNSDHNTCIIYIYISILKMVGSRDFFLSLHWNFFHC